MKLKHRHALQNLAGDTRSEVSAYTSYSAASAPSAVSATSSRYTYTRRPYSVDVLYQDVMDIGQVGPNFRVRESPAPPREKSALSRPRSRGDMTPYRLRSAASLPSSLPYVPRPPDRERYGSTLSLLSRQGRGEVSGAKAAYSHIIDRVEVQYPKDNAVDLAEMRHRPAMLLPKSRPRQDIYTFMKKLQEFKVIPADPKTQMFLASSSSKPRASSAVSSVSDVSTDLDEEVIDTDDSGYIDSYVNLKDVKRLRKDTLRQRFEAKLRRKRMAIEAQQKKEGECPNCQDLYDMHGGKVKFLNWFWGRWAGKEKKDIEEVEENVRKTHQPHFCNFVKKIDLHGRDDDTDSGYPRTRKKSDGVTSDSGSAYQNSDAPIRAWLGDDDGRIIEAKSSNSSLADAASLIIKMKRSLRGSSRSRSKKSSSQGDDWDEEDGDWLSENDEDELDLEKALLSIKKTQYQFSPDDTGSEGNGSASKSGSRKSSSRSRSRSGRSRRTGEDGEELGSDYSSGSEYSEYSDGGTRSIRVSSGKKSSVRIPSAGTAPGSESYAGDGEDEDVEEEGSCVCPCHCHSATSIKEQRRSASSVYSRRISVSSRPSSCRSSRPQSSKSHRSGSCKRKKPGSGNRFKTSPRPGSAKPRRADSARSVRSRPSTVGSKATRSGSSLCRECRSHSSLVDGELRCCRPGSSGAGSSKASRESSAKSRPHSGHEDDHHGDDHHHHHHGHLCKGKYSHSKSCPLGFGTIAKIVRLKRKMPKYTEFERNSKDRRSATGKEVEEEEEEEDAAFGNDELYQQGEDNLEDAMLQFKYYDKKEDKEKEEDEESDTNVRDDDLSAKQIETILYRNGIEPIAEESEDGSSGIGSAISPTAPPAPTPAESVADDEGDGGNDEDDINARNASALAMSGWSGNCAWKKPPRKYSIQAPIKVDGSSDEDEDGDGKLKLGGVPTFGRKKRREAVTESLGEEEKKSAAYVVAALPDARFRQRGSGLWGKAKKGASLFEGGERRPSITPASEVPEEPVLVVETQTEKTEPEIPPLPEIPEPEEKTKKKGRKSKIEEAPDLKLRVAPRPKPPPSKEKADAEFKYTFTMNDITATMDSRKAKVQSWLAGRLALSQQACRFELPMDMKVLENMSPGDYLSKFCVISTRRSTLYSKVFTKFKDKQGKIIMKDLDRSLREVLINTITSEDIKQVVDLAQLDETSKVDLKLFSGLAAMAERILYPKYLTEDTLDIPDHKKEKIECADFSALEWKFHGVQVNRPVRRILESL